MSGTQARDWSDILDKLGKLKTLSDRAGTLAEAEAAAAAMTRLLLKYNLSMVDVTAHLDGSANPVKRVDDPLENTAMWRTLLIYEIAKANLCDLVRLNGGKTVALFGHDHNLIVVKELYLWLVGEIDRLADAAWKARKAAL